MADTAVTATQLPSAAARVFAIPELCEKILLELISSEIKCPALRPLENVVARYFHGVRPEYIEDQFRLLHINRHTYATIVKSKPIQASCFAPTSIQARPITTSPHRLVWLSLACRRFMVGKALLGEPVLLFPARPKQMDDLALEDSPWASWRKYPVGGSAMTFTIMQTMYGRMVAYVPDKNTEPMEFRVQPEWTLGELYDKIVEIEPKEVGVTLASRPGKRYPTTTVSLQGHPEYP